MEMNRFKSSLGILVVLGLTAAQPARGYSLAFVPSAPSVKIGDPLDVDVEIAGAGTAVAAFDLHIGYASGLLTPTGASFGPFLGDPALLEALTALDTGIPGVFEIAEVSLLSAADLDGLQPPSLSGFTLATLEFLAQAPGAPTFGLVGNSNAVDDVNGRKLQLMPEPAVGYLMLPGLAWVIWMRHRAQAGKWCFGDSLWRRRKNSELRRSPTIWALQPGPPGLVGYYQRGSQQSACLD